MSRNSKKMFLCLLVGWVGLQAVVAVAATSAASVTSDADEVIDTRVNLGAFFGLSDAWVDTRINFVSRSPAPGAKIDTLTPCGTLLMVR